MVCWASCSVAVSGWAASDSPVVVAALSPQEARISEAATKDTTHVASPGMSLLNPFDGGSPSLSMPLTHIRSDLGPSDVSVSHESRVGVVRTANYP